MAVGQARRPRSATSVIGYGTAAFVIQFVSNGKPPRIIGQPGGAQQTGNGFE